MVLNLKSLFLTFHFKTKFDQVVSLFFILCKQTHFPIERQVFFCSVGRQPGAFIHKQMWIKSGGDRATARTNIFQKHIVLWENAFSVNVWQVGGHGPLPPTFVIKIHKGHDPNPWFSGIILFSGWVLWSLQIKKRSLMGCLFFMLIFWLFSFWPIKSADLQKWGLQSKIWTRWHFQKYLL